MRWWKSFLKAKSNFYITQSMEYKKHLEDLLATVIKEGGSDIHLSEGRHPTIRVSGVLIPLLKQPIILINPNFLALPFHTQHPP